MTGHGTQGGAGDDSAEWRVSGVERSDADPGDDRVRLYALAAHGPSAARGAESANKHLPLFGKMQKLHNILTTM
jgi:hypothetical protein